MKININTKNIQINKIKKKDLTEKYMSWLNNKDLNQYSEQRHEKHTLRTIKNFYTKVQKSNNILLGIRLKKEKKLVHIGNIFVRIDIHNRIAGLSFMIGDKDYRNRGIGLRVWKLMIKEILINSDIRIVKAQTIKPNIAMIKIIKKSQMKLEFIFKKRNLFNGDEVDVLYASMTKKRFNQIIKHDKNYC